MRKFLIIALAALLVVTGVAVADIVAASFPSTVWDGSSSTRAKRTTHRIPGAEDWDTISAEVIGIEGALSNVQALGTKTTGTVTIDLSLGTFVTVTDGGAFTIAFSNPPAGSYQVTLVVTNGGSATITWPTTTWLNDGGVAPTLTTSGVDIIRLFSPDHGTTLYGTKAGQLRTTDIGSAVVTPAKLSPTGWKTYVVTGAASAAAITMTGAAVGDRVLMAFQVTSAGGGLVALTPGTEIESTITIINQIQQLSASNLSTKSFWVVTLPAGS